MSFVLLLHSSHVGSNCFLGLSLLLGRLYLKYEGGTDRKHRNKFIILLPSFHTWLQNHRWFCTKRFTHILQGTSVALSNRMDSYYKHNKPKLKQNRVRIHMVHCICSETIYFDRHNLGCINESRINTLTTRKYLHNLNWSNYRYSHPSGV